MDRGARGPASPRRKFDSKSSRSYRRHDDLPEDSVRDEYDHPMYSSRYPGRGGGYGGGYRGEVGSGGYPAYGSNRNQFHPGHIRPPYHNPNYLGKPKNNKYYQHQLQMGLQPEMGQFGPDGAPYENGGPQHFMSGHRFNTSYRFNAKFGGGDQYGNPHYQGYNPNYKGQMHPGGYMGKGKAGEAQTGSPGDETKADAA